MRLYRLNQTATPVSTTSYDREGIRPEQMLESWLDANPHLILDEPLLMIGRQVQLETGVADLVAVDRFANTVICEVKIGRSGSGSASEETILSQPQNYAQAISTYDYDTLDTLYQDNQDSLTSTDESTRDDGGNDLRAAFESTFGGPLDVSAVNTYQRMVVVAEEITRRTEQNARYLLQEGLNFQCVEIQRFEPLEYTDTDVKKSVLARNIVVDYDLNRVRPKHRESPTYPALASEILERAFPKFRSLVEADSVKELLPNGVDTREHRLVSANPDHPDSLVYRLGIKPDQGTIRVAIDIPETDELAYDRIQQEAPIFSDNDFEVTGNTTYRVVVDEWTLDEATDGRDLIGDVADRYALLVELGHRVLMNPSTE